MSAWRVHARARMARVRARPLRRGAPCGVAAPASEEHRSDARLDALLSASCSAAAPDALIRARCDLGDLTSLRSQSGAISETSRLFRSQSDAFGGDNRLHKSQSGAISETSGLSDRSPMRLVETAVSMNRSPVRSRRPRSSASASGSVPTPTTCPAGEADAVLEMFLTRTRSPEQSTRNARRQRRIGGRAAREVTSDRSRPRAPLPRETRERRSRDGTREKP